jgi:hypothetical protein
MASHPSIGPSQVYDVTPTLPVGYASLHPHESGLSTLSSVLSHSVRGTRCLRRGVQRGWQSLMPMPFPNRGGTIDSQGLKALSAMNITLTTITPTVNTRHKVRP